MSTTHCDPEDPDVLEALYRDRYGDDYPLSDTTGRLIGALTWLLDDLRDAGEDRDPVTGMMYDSVAFAHETVQAAKPEAHEPPLVRVALDVSAVVPDDAYLIRQAEELIWESIFNEPDRLSALFTSEPAYGSAVADIPAELARNHRYAEKELLR